MLLIRSILIVTIVVTVKSDYVRELFDYDADIDEAHYKNEFIQKEPQHYALESDNCDDQGCKISVSKSMNIITRKGYGVSLYIKSLGLLNTTFSMVVKKVEFNVTLDYKYTSMLGKYYYRNAFENYDSSGYSDCVNNKGNKDMFSVYESKELGKEGDDWNYVDRKSYKMSLGGWGTSATRCGHYWATTLRTCFEKVLVVKRREGLAVFKIDNELSFALSIELTVNGRIYNSNYEGNTNEPMTVDLGDGLFIEFNPIGEISNPIVGNHLVAHVKFDSKPSVATVMDWYHKDNVPGLGDIPSQGIGRFQLVSLNIPQQTLYDKNRLLFNEEILDCSMVRSEFNENNVNRRLKGSPDESLKDLFDIEKSEEVFYTKYVASHNLTTTGVMTGDSCCIRISSPSDLYMSSVIKSMTPAIVKYKGKQLSLPPSFKINSDGKPDQFSARFQALTTTSVLTTLRTEDFMIGYQKGEFELSNVTVSKMMYYPNAAGSNFQVNFNYKGSAANVPLISKEVNLLHNEVFVSNTGPAHFTVGFKSVGRLLLAPKICVGTESTCVRPTDWQVINNPDGSVDDPDDNQDSSIHNKIHNFLALIISNIWFGLFILLIWLIDFIIITTLLVVVFRLFGKFVFFFLLASSKDVNAFVTNNPFETFSPGLNCHKLETGADHIDLYHKTFYIGAEDIKLSPESNIISISKKTIDKNPATDCRTRSHKTIYKNEKVWFNNMLCVGDSQNTTFTAYYSAPYDINMGSQCFADYGFFDYWSYTDVLHLMKKTHIEYIDYINQKKEVCYRLLTYTSDLNKYGVNTFMIYCPYAVFEIAHPMEYLQMSMVTSIEKIGKPGGLHTIVITALVDTYYPVNIVKDNILKEIEFEGDADVSAMPYVPNSGLINLRILIVCSQTCTFKEIDPFTKPKYRLSAIKGNLYIDNKYAMIEKMIDVDLSNSSTFSKSAITYKLGIQEIYQFEDKNMFLSIDRTNYMSLINKKDSVKIRELTREDTINSIVSTLVNEKGIYIITTPGPIKMPCEFNGKSSYCKNTAGTALVVGETPISVTRSSIEIKFMGVEKEVLNRKHQLDVDPSAGKCNGDLFIDSRSRLQCSIGCCMISYDNWSSFEFVFAEIPHKTNKSFTGINHWKNGKSLLYNIKSAGECDTGSFSSALQCANDNYPWIMFLTIFIVPMFICLYVVICLILFIVKYYTSRSFKKVTLKNKKDPEDTRWFPMIMADNLTSGKLKFWHKERPYRNNEVYKETVEPFISKRPKLKSALADFKV